MSKMEEIRQIQNLLDERTRVEKQAEKLICQCKFEEAIELLETLKSL